MAKGASKSAGRTLGCPEVVAGEHRRIGAHAVSGGATSTGDSGQAAPLGRPRPTAGLVERPLPGNGHGGCGRRLGETHRWKHRQGAPGRPHSCAPRRRSSSASQAWRGGAVRAVNQAAGSSVLPNRTSSHREARSTPQISCVRYSVPETTKGSTSYSRAMSRPRSATTSSIRAIPWRENGGYTIIAAGSCASAVVCSVDAVFCVGRGCDQRTTTALGPTPDDSRTGRRKLWRLPRRTAQYAPSSCVDTPRTLLPTGHR